MIDLDVIQQTENIATGTHLPWWAIGVCIAVLFAVAAPSISFNRLEWAVKALIHYKDMYGDARRANDIDKMVEEHKKLITTHPSTLLSALGVSISLCLAYFLGAVWFSVALLVTTILMFWLARRRLDAASAAQIDDNDLRLLVRDQHETTMMHSLLAGGCSLVLLVLVAVVPRVPDVHMVPTEAAQTELADAEQKITTAVTDAYDVEVLEDNTCMPWSSEPTHEERAEFVEAALSGGPSDDAQLRLLTGDGVVGCYTVMYDQESQSARLVVDAEDTDLPSPRELKKG